MTFHLSASPTHSSSMSSLVRTFLCWGLSLLFFTAAGPVLPPAATSRLPHSSHDSSVSSRDPVAAYATQCSESSTGLIPCWMARSRTASEAERVESGRTGQQVPLTAVQQWRAGLQKDLELAKRLYQLFLHRRSVFRQLPAKPSDNAHAQSDNKNS